MFALIVVLATAVGIAFLIRALAQRSILWVAIPANCYGLVTTFGNTSGDLTKGGGGVTNVVHNIPGRKLIRKGHNLMEWHFTLGKEQRSFLFWLLGVEWIGPFRTLRTNKIRRFRYGKRKMEDKKKDVAVKDGELFRDYFVEDDDLITQYIPFSGEMAISVTDVETKDVYELNFLFNIIEEAIYPLKSIRVADPNAILAGMFKERVNAIVGPHPPDMFIKATPKSTKMIVKAAEKATADAEDEIGKRIVQINLVTTDMDEKDRALFELAARTRMQNAAREAEAETNRIVAFKKNDSDEDRNNRVILPIAKAGEMAVRVRQAEAYENNTTVTTYAPGSEKMVPVGGK